MKSGFYIIMAAQFFSSLADNALLITAIELLIRLQEPAWMTPTLKITFTFSYVLLAPFVGAFADSMPKGRVMFVTNTVKVIGCTLMFFNVHPLLAYAVVGIGAAGYSPAKYGILTELLPPAQLVKANGWIEGLTVGSIIFGVLLGGYLVNPRIYEMLLSIDLPGIDTGIDSPIEVWLLSIGGLYLLAAIFNLFVPGTGVNHSPPSKNPFFLVREFIHCNRLLWQDRLGQISLAVTTLFWGAGATLQFVVLKWAEVALHMPLHQASQLQGVVAIGVAIGAITAAKIINLENAMKVLPFGMAMGLAVFMMIFLRQMHWVIPGMILIGALAGFFVVPMNALLQHRGHVLMGAGHSIAVQNFNENLSILIMIMLYAALVWLDLSIYWVIILFGLFVAGTMLAIMRRHQINQNILYGNA